MMYSTLHRTVKTSGAITTAYTGTDQASNGAADITVHVNVSAFTGTTATFAIEFYDEAAGAWFNPGLTNTAVTAAARQTFKFGVRTPTAAAASNVVALNVAPPPRWRLVTTGTFTVTTMTFTAWAVFAY